MRTGDPGSDDDFFVFAVACRSPSLTCRLSCVRSGEAKNGQCLRTNLYFCFVAKGLVRIGNLNFPFSWP